MDDDLLNLDMVRTACSPRSAVVLAWLREGSGRATFRSLLSLTGMNNDALRRTLESLQAYGLVRGELGDPEDGSYSFFRLTAQGQQAYSIVLAALDGARTVRPGPVSNRFLVDAAALERMLDGAGGGPEGVSRLFEGHVLVMTGADYADAKESLCGDGGDGSLEEFLDDEGRVRVSMSYDSVEDSVAVEYHLRRAKKLPPRAARAVATAVDEGASIITDDARVRAAAAGLGVAAAGTGAVLGMGEGRSLRAQMPAMSMAAGGAEGRGRKGRTGRQPGAEGLALLGRHCDSARLRRERERAADPRERDPSAAAPAVYAHGRAAAAPGAAAAAGAWEKWAEWAAFDAPALDGGAYGGMDMEGMLNRLALIQLLPSSIDQGPDGMHGGWDRAGPRAARGGTKKAPVGTDLPDMGGAQGVLEGAMIMMSEAGRDRLSAWTEALGTAGGAREMQDWEGAEDGPYLLAPARRHPGREHGGEPGPAGTGEDAWPAVRPAGRVGTAAGQATGAAGGGAEGAQEAARRLGGAMARYAGIGVRRRHGWPPTAGKVPGQEGQGPPGAGIAAGSGGTGAAGGRGADGRMGADIRMARYSIPERRFRSREDPESAPCHRRQRIACRQNPARA